MKTGIYSAVMLAALAAPFAASAQTGNAYAQLDLTSSPTAQTQLPPDVRAAEARVATRSGADDAALWGVGGVPGGTHRSGMSAQSSARAVLYLHH
ncbi:conserved exported hypothetical protein [Paraburkholderia unamae]|uniref:hypothetical protein n=1 Tax=Paraburkholderia unamae TaxID=219649 RepID=UPI001CB395B8|nr:hypothetical protein [Paraburkholderia unamae]CAG9275136.1 conserved exported hypothetical protein [Paraburkholderia unamae]